MLCLVTHLSKADAYEKFVTVVQPDEDAEVVSLADDVRHHALLPCFIADPLWGGLILRTKGITVHFLVCAAELVSASELHDTANFLCIFRFRATLGVHGLHNNVPSGSRFIHTISLYAMPLGLLLCNVMIAQL